MEDYESQQNCLQVILQEILSDEEISHDSSENSEISGPENSSNSNSNYKKNETFV